LLTYKKAAEGGQGKVTNKKKRGSQETPTVNNKRARQDALQSWRAKKAAGKAAISATCTK
jgi:hypothetical protein